jgi:hypothetical protein
MGWDLSMLARLLQLDDQSIDDMPEAQRLDAIAALSEEFPDVAASKRALARKERQRRRWSPAGLATLRRLYADTPSKEIAHRVGRSIHQVYAKAADLGLEKSATYMAGPHACRLRRGDHVGARFRYPKGHIPANKGLRRPGFSPGRMAETQFKKGEATNWKPVGATRLVDGYVYRKVSDIRHVPWTRNWRCEHFLMWEKAFGPVPDGHAIAFKDGDRTHVVLENLELISRRELMARNTVHNLPPEIVEVIQLRGALVRQINRRSRAHEKQDSGPAQPPLRDARSVEGPREADGHRPGESGGGSGSGPRQLRQGRGRVHPRSRRLGGLGLHPGRATAGTKAAQGGGKLT